jgi:hypothetical protein
MTQEKAPIRFYKGFLDEDWCCLPGSVRQELTDFLEALQSAPTDEGLLARCEVHETGVRAYSLPDGYFLFFQVEKTANSILNVLELMPRHFRIVVLDVSVPH